MGFKSFDDINELHIDVLRELANIGSGNAAAALARMTGHPTDISIPEICIRGFNDAYNALGGAGEIMVGILLTLSEDLDGMMMFLLPVPVACDLVNLLVGSDVKTYEEIDEIGISAINEVANIMSASFVSAIGDMTDLTIDISPPESTLDMLGSIMSVPSIYYARISDTLLLMQNEIEISGKTTSANVMLLPDIPSLEKLMNSLGIEV